MEDVGRVVLAQEGRTLIYERIPPYETAPNIDTLYSQDDRSALAHLYVLDLDRPGEPRQLFEQDARGGYWIGALSPNEARLALYSMVDGAVRAGVFDLQTKRIRWFEFTPNYFWFHQTPVWVSDEDILYPALPSGVQPSILYRRGLITQMQRLWQGSLDGTEPSATVVQSGSDSPNAPIPPQQGRLVRVRSSTGELEELVPGYFYNFRLSPDRRYAAVLREGRPIQPTAAADLGDAIDRISRDLIVIDLQQRRILTPCPTCNVSLGTIEWSLDDSRLTFFARSTANAANPGQYFEYRARDEALLPIDISHLRISCGLYGTRPRRLIAVDGSILVLARTDSREEAQGFVGSDCGRESRFDWFRLGPSGSHENLTQQLKGLSIDPLGARAGRLSFFAADGVWDLALTGEARRILRAEEGMRPWRKGLESGTISEEVQYFGLPPPSDVAVLEVNTRIVVLDLRTGQARSVRKPAIDAQLRALSAGPSTTAVFQHDSPGGSKLAIVRDGGAPRELITFNSALAEVAPERSMQLSYTFKGRKLSGCAILPPNWESSRKYSTVVFVYPHLGGQCAASPVRSFNPYHNPHLLASHGYVVLFPNTSAHVIEGPEGPTANLTGAVLAAVAASETAGLTDEDHLLLFGTSQGSHSAMQVVTETQRFKAVIASFGISDFISQYGSMPLYVRLGRDSFGVGDAARFENKDSPNYLGAQPWQDPLRYVRNSPLFYVDRITTPVLIIHSDLDQFSLNQSEELFSALYRLGKRATYVTYWGEGHGVLSPANVRDMWRRIFEWYDTQSSAVR
jgi:acetyl esterase/lipase